MITQTILQKSQSSSTLKDLKENFTANQTCRLINLVKSELGKNKIIKEINAELRTILDQNQ